jgi:amino-acid N-acetyltransferase
MKRDVALVRAREKDVPFMMDLLRQSALPFSDIPEKVDSLFLVRSGSVVVGIGGVELMGEYGLLRSLAIEKEEQGKGYGLAVVNGLMDHARQGGVRELYLLTTTATPFFARFGFEKVGRDQAPRVITQTSEFAGL